MLESLTSEAFAPYIGSIFTAHFGEDGSYPLLLDEAAPVKLRGAKPSQSRSPFSLFFSGPGPQYLLQGTYRLGHPQMGDLEIFIVPVGELGDGYRYQAAFN
jgi:hypothetical protein